MDRRAFLTGAAAFGLGVAAHEPARGQSFPTNVIRIVVPQSASTPPDILARVMASALTEGEGGLEEALMAAIGKEESLIDPKELFRATAAQSEINDEDAAYWNVEVVATETIQAQAAAESADIPPQRDLFEHLQAVPEPAALQLPMLEAAPAAVETPDVLLKVLEDCGGQITSIAVNDEVSKLVLPAKVASATTPKKPNRRRLDLLAAPADEPISPLDILAGKASTPTRPAPRVPAVESTPSREPLQLALF